MLGYACSSLGIFFYSLFFFLFILEVGPNVSHYPNHILVYPYYKHWSNIQSHYLVHALTRVFYTMPSFGKYKLMIL
jgi:hypothetical protein